jgi:succinate-semialdehyde dehydrogenase / glutarate-semialdehyde dehydrogenase
MVDVAIPSGRLQVNGSPRAASSGSEFSVFDPADQRLLAMVADASAEDGLAAVDAAVSALAPFAALAPRERAEILRKAFELMTERSEELALLIVAENGKALPDARSEVTYAAEFFRWFAEEAVRVAGELAIAPTNKNRILVMYQPIGVSLLVTPWNFPAAMLTRKIGPALAAGCSVVCKPAEDTPLTALAIGEILTEAGAPPGVVNIVPTSDPGPLVSAILKDPRVRKLSFTGSSEVGRILLAQASTRVISCSMELGGNAPFIVFADADLDKAVQGAMIAKLRNGGEACTAANRFYVEAAVAEEFSARLSAAMGGLRMGPGSDPEVGIGPLINAAAVKTVSSLVEDAIRGGARALIGASLPEGSGNFYPPTVLVDLAPDAEMLHQEIFGPVAPVVAFTSEDEVVRLANDTEYGLVAYLYTKDLARGLRVSERLEAGMIGLNRGVVSDPAAPFGGVKQSGLGREGGHHGILEYLEAKYIATDW